jgi:uncharacterized membrane protein YkvA (DUF1232 family)
MSFWLWLLLGLLALYGAFVLALALAGRREHARAMAGFVPDCAVLLKRLAAEPRLPRRQRVALVLMLGYLASPIDLVPDFIPVAGQLDDAILVALVLRSVVRRAGANVVREHWPGPPSSLGVVMRMAGLAASANAS